MITNATVPSPKEIASIIGLEQQPVLRNLKITQCYHDLSQAIAAMVGSENANWCSFATWASKTAGRFIRADEVLPIFRRAFADLKDLAARLDRINRTIAAIHPNATLRLGAVLQALAAPVQEVSRHIAAGNLAVFAELGPIFSLVCARGIGQPRYDAAALAELLRQLALKQGLPAEGGQSYLQSAVQFFYRAKFETHSDRKAEWLLLANAQTGLHEQMRLQPAIAGSLRPPFNNFLAPLYRAHNEEVFSGPLRERLEKLTQTTLAPIFSAIDEELNQAWRETATRLLMTLQLPDGEIHLGHDLRAQPGKPLFAPSLRSIEYADLRKLLAYYHADRPDGVGSAAQDWADIPERMQFILTLFRARQQDRRLFEQPFSAEQRKALSENCVPSGPL